MRTLLTLVAASTIMAGAALAQTTTTTPATDSNTNAATPDATVKPAPNADANGTAGGGSSNGAVNPPGNAPSNVNASGTISTVPMSALEKGANSFTEGQARSRIESAGFGNVTDLKKDDAGIWRGKGMRNGKSVNIGFDYKGNLAAE